MYFHKDNVNTPFSVIEGQGKKSFLTNAFTWMHFFFGMVGVILIYTFSRMKGRTTIHKGKCHIMQ